LVAHFLSSLRESLRGVHAPVLLGARRIRDDGRNADRSRVRRDWARAGSLFLDCVNGDAAAGARELLLECAGDVYAKPDPAVAQ